MNKGVTCKSYVTLSRDTTLPTKVRIVKAMIFPAVMYGCSSWTIKKAEHGRIYSFEVWCWNRLLRVPWTARRSNQVHPKENQSWIFIRKTDAEAETLVLWPLIWRTDSLEKTDAGKDWGQEEKGATENEMVGWHHWLNGHEIEQTPGDSEGQESLACCSPWDLKELDMT